MKTKEFESFKANVSLSIALDSVMRSITEKIKLIHQSHDYESIQYVIDMLRSTDDDIDKLIKEQLCTDE